MSVLNDLYKELDFYARDRCKVEIIDFKMFNEQSVLNIGRVTVGVKEIIKA